jgi:NADH-quinone oxidoreductase subunit H
VNPAILFLASEDMYPSRTEGVLSLAERVAYDWGLLPYGWALLLCALAAAVVIILFVMLPLAGFSTLVERKVAAWTQRRVGPNQVGAPPILMLDRILRVKMLKQSGVLQFMADGLKLFVKEDIIPDAADKPLFRLAPYVVIASAFLASVALPFSDRFYGVDLSIGVFYLLAVGSAVALGIVMAGWASNNKWSLLGGMRAAAQIVSYEIPGVLAVVAVIMLSGQLSMQALVQDQQGWFWNWNLFGGSASTRGVENALAGGGLAAAVCVKAVIAAVMLALGGIYYISGLAECNRTPFDIPEAENELVCGYHTEYSGMRFGMFFMGEYINMIVVSAIVTTLFFGGYYTGIGPVDAWLIKQAPGSAEWFAGGLVEIGVFMFKTYFFGMILLQMLVRWTLPRLRVDQMMNLCWKRLTPAAFVALAVLAGAMLLLR